MSEYDDQHETNQRFAELLTLLSEGLMFKCGDETIVVDEIRSDGKVLVVRPPTGAYQRAVEPAQLSIIREPDWDAADAAGSRDGGGPA